VKAAGTRRWQDACGPSTSAPETVQQLAAATSATQRLARTMLASVSDLVPFSDEGAHPADDDIITIASLIVHCYSCIIVRCLQHQHGALGGVPWHDTVTPRQP